MLRDNVCIFIVATGHTCSNLPDVDGSLTAKTSVPVIMFCILAKLLISFPLSQTFAFLRPGHTPCLAVHTLLLSDLFCLA